MDYRPPADEKKVPSGCTGYAGLQGGRTRTCRGEVCHSFSDGRRIHSPQHPDSEPETRNPASPLLPQRRQGSFSPPPCPEPVEGPRFCESVLLQPSSLQRFAIHVLLRKEWDYDIVAGSVWRFHSCRLGFWKFTVELGKVK